MVQGVLTRAALSTAMNKHFHISHHSLLLRFNLSSALQIHDFVEMALSARLLGRSWLSCQGLRPVYVSHVRPVTIQAKPAEAPREEGHDEKNLRLCRPQSPHLTIYKLQLTSGLSITHRFTGMILSGYAATFAGASLLSDRSMCELMTHISSSYPNFFMVFKFGLIFPFTYHFFNGIRHLIWDTGSALTIRGVYITGYLMLLCTAIASGTLIYMAHEQKRKGCHCSGKKGKGHKHKKKN